MSQPNDPIKSRSNSDLAFYAGVGALMLLISVALTAPLLVGGVVYLGEWIGGKHSHPLLGTLCAAGILFVLLLGAVIVSVRLKRRKDRNPSPPGSSLKLSKKTSLPTLPGR
jgi:hypothetical protein